jgi:2-dehydropantoate 2-reductase
VRVRFIVFGAGGIGCTIGARLHQSGHDVLLIARGRQFDALRDSGLTLRTPGGDHHFDLPVVSHPSDVRFTTDDVVFLTMKTQDTEAALRDLELAAGPDIPVICAQNGVENERLASRRFRNIYAMLVALPATFLEPGQIIASAAPLTGALHAGRYPSGVDDTIATVCSALDSSNFTSEPDPAVMRLKYRKLLLNLGNGVELATHRLSWGASGTIGEFTAALREEGLRCFAAAGIDSAPADEYETRVISRYKAQPVGGEARSASSTWQGVLRGNTIVESDYLNGEIVLLGALHGVPTPYNTAVRRAAVVAAAAGPDAPAHSLEALLDDVRKLGG